MLDQELKFIHSSGIDPDSEIFKKLEQEYRSSFEKKIGKPTIIDGIEIFTYKGEQFTYCKPYGEGQYGRNLRFAVNHGEHEDMGKMDEYSKYRTAISIPMSMCTDKTAKIFPVKKVNFKIIDGAVKPIIAKEASLINEGKTYDLKEDEDIRVADECLMFTSNGIRHIQTGDVLYACENANNPYFKKDNLEETKLCYTDYKKNLVTIPLKEVYDKIDRRLNVNAWLNHYGLTYSDFSVIKKEVDKQVDLYMHNEDKKIDKV